MYHFDGRLYGPQTGFPHLCAFIYRSLLGKMRRKNSSVFELVTQGLDLRLRFSGPDHEDWLSVFVEISAEPFSGTYAFQMLSLELQALRETLLELDRSVGKMVEFSWKNYKGNIQLRLSLHSRGQIVGHYRFAAGKAWEGATLLGEFHQIKVIWAAGYSNLSRSNVSLPNKRSETDSLRRRRIALSACTRRPFR
jgi:hypothetical protein